jgi:ADP-ribosylglycohydrolase
MIGAIIGDIVGSIYEFDNIKTKDFPMFGEDNTFTDDTVMTLAVAEGLMNGGRSDDFINAMKKYGRLYPYAGYGGRFDSWLRSDNRAPYNSYGNGSAMRVSPCGWAFDTLEDVESVAGISAAVTHNHIEGIKGAQATAASIFLARIGKSKTDIKTYIESKYRYDLNLTLDNIRRTYKFDESCQGTVPQAIIAFLESTDFEDAIRNAISLGGDSDTLAAITGSIAEAAYGVPDEIRDKSLRYLDATLREVYERCRKHLTLASKGDTLYTKYTESVIIKYKLDSYITLNEYLADCRFVSEKLPRQKGVYFVIYPHESPDEAFLQEGTGGYYKGKNPNISVELLHENWVEDADILYIGETKATLRERVTALLKFGNGKNVAHRGGRLLWQHKESHNFRVYWYACSDNENPVELEKELIKDFKTHYNEKRPFANLTDGG